MNRNEPETRAELIDPQLAASGWGVVPASNIRREYQITAGRIQSGGRRGEKLIADYILQYNGQKLAIIEAKQESLPASAGVAQAKAYAAKLDIRMAYATNGRQIYQMDLLTGAEEEVSQFPTPAELWAQKQSAANEWLNAFNAIPLEDFGGGKPARYYQETAINKALSAIAENRQRILLTLATGTGKTHIAFQIVWKLFQSRWNLRRDGARRPRILFLADRNILADQAFTNFIPFPDDALVRVRPEDIRKKGHVPTNGAIFFTIFQTFMSGTAPNGEPAPYFGDYPADFFDLVIIDECHRGGANDESNWRDILDYFKAAVQLGLTATPKRQDNVDTYAYFGEPVYTYSLKAGINDGFLTPYKIKVIQTTVDDYTYAGDDLIIEGEVDRDKYTESDFNRIIEIRERELKRVRLLLQEMNHKQKALVFCASQEHAALIRDLINQEVRSFSPTYCVRVTADDGALGEQYLREFQDNEKTVPTILTTSHKLSTGVDARNVRHIVLLRPVNSMIEFKQIVGRGTRLFEGKAFFTLYDFVGAHEHFQDPEWDGEPLGKTTTSDIFKDKPDTPYNASPPDEDDEEEIEKQPRTKLRIKLAPHNEREIQHMVDTLYYDVSGKPISAAQFAQNLYGELPNHFSTEEELRELWGNPVTRAALLKKLEHVGFGRDQLESMQQLVNAEDSDLLDVLEYIQFSTPPITRTERVRLASSHIFALLNEEQKQFLEFVLAKYIESGVEELGTEKLPDLLKLKYHALADAQRKLGDVQAIRTTFVAFQRYLYAG